MVGRRSAGPAARRSDIAVTAGQASLRNWPAVVRVWTTAGRVLTELVIGAGAGLCPARRAPHLAPIEALAAPCGDPYWNAGPLHFDYGLTETPAREHSVERRRQVIQALRDVRLEPHSSVGEPHFELVAHFGDQMLP